MDLTATSQMWFPERIARGKRSSLFIRTVSYKQEKFYNIDDDGQMPSDDSFGAGDDSFNTFFSETKWQSYKTFSVRNLRIFVIS
jgi:hypothetical protein